MIDLKPPALLASDARRIHVDAPPAVTAPNLIADSLGRAPSARIGDGASRGRLDEERVMAL